MGVLPGEEIWDDILKKYNKKPHGRDFKWGAITYRSPGGFYDALIYSPDAAWLLKKDTIYKTKPTVIGIEIKDFDFERSAPRIRIPRVPGMPQAVGKGFRRGAEIPYGFRNVDMKEVMEFTMEMKSEVEQGLKTPNQAVNAIMKKVMQSTLKATRRLPQQLSAIEPPILEGPYVVSGLESISKQQRELSAKLDADLRRMMHRRYPFYG